MIPFALPFVLFMAMLAAADGILRLGRHEFWLAHPLYWIFPLQTLVCGALLIRFWRRYRLQFPKRAAFSIAIAILVFLLWISPQAFLHQPPRLSGNFDPGVFPFGTALYWSALGLRFLRLVVVVPLVEEIFWRGFLMRALIKKDFESVPVGAFSWASFCAVAAGFGLEHWGPDFPAGLAAGVLYNLVAIRTRSLGSCVLAHATTNLLLGAYIMHTQQWGFW